MTSFQPGEILLVDFPFAGGSQTKVRPALVLLDTGDLDVILARITTQQHQTPYDVVIQDWKGAGLVAPSQVRIHKLITSEKSQVVRGVGKLTPVDHQVVSAALRQVFGNW